MQTCGAGCWIIRELKITILHINVIVTDEMGCTESITFNFPHDNIEEGIKKKRFGMGSFAFRVSLRLSRVRMHLPM
jgi:hypothetical protein